MELKESRSKKKNKTIPSYELAIFCHEAAIIFKAGISSVEGLEIISGETGEAGKAGKTGRSSYRRFVKALKLMEAYVADGMSFTDSLRKCGCFPEYMINMAAIGEASGNLDIVMEYLADHYEKKEKYAGRVRAAVTYPIILSVLMSCVVLLLITEVLPMFNDILESAGGDIPALARLLASGGTLAASVLPYAVPAVIAAAAVLILYFKTAGGRKRLDILKLKIPVLKRIYTRIIAARVGHGMSVMLKSGLGYGQALTLVSGVTGNTHAQQLLGVAEKGAAEGRGLPELFNECGIFPPLFVKMADIGRKTGKMEDMLKKASEIYENEADNMLQKLTSSIEPVLVFILSSVIGIILLTVMIPLIGILASIG